MGRGMWFLLMLVHVGVAVWGMVNAWKGKEKKMPFFGEVADKLKW